MILSTFISANQMSILVGSRLIGLHRGTVHPKKKKRTAEARLPAEGAKRLASLPDSTRNHQPSDLGNLNVN